MSPSPLQLRNLVTREKRAEKTAWRETLLSPIGALLDNGQLVPCAATEDGRRLVPDTPGHRFRDNEQVCLLPAPLPLTTSYTDARGRGHETRFLDGLTTTGELLLQRPVAAATAGYLVGQSGPLLDFHDWQKAIVDQWLAGDGADASEMRAWLEQPPADEDLREPVHADEPWQVVRDQLGRGDRVTLVQGPPGCGKTRLAARLLAHLLREHPKRSLGAFTFTNRACDHLLKALCEYAPDLAPRIRRHGNPGGHRRELAPLGIASAKDTAPTAGCLVASTLYQLTRHVHQQLGQDAPRFDLILVDEASQATLPTLCSPVAAAEQTLLIGDQRQLPPVLVSQPLDVRERALYTSAFEHLVARRPYLFLARTHRMRAPVCAISSVAFYGGELTSAVDIPWASPLPEDPHLHESPGVQLVSVDRRDGDGPLTSTAEAETIVALIEAWENTLSKLLARTHEAHQPGGPRYLISCFYRAQVALVRAVLAERLPPDLLGWLHVDTVERNQGQSCLVGFLSVGEDGRSEGRPLEWRLDPRRLNVAITRARLKTYLLASPAFVVSHAP